MKASESVPFYRLLSAFAAPLLSVVLMVFGSAFFTTYVSIFLNSRGYERSLIGLTQSAYFLGMLVGAFQMEKLIKRVGNIQVLAVFGSLATSATLLQGLNYDLAAWILLRFLVGISLAAIYIVIESWMLHESTPTIRGVVLSLYMICLYTSQAVSQQVISYIMIESSTPFLISALFTSLSVIPVGLAKSRIQLPEQHEPIKLLEISKISPFGVAGCLASGLLLSSIYTFLPLFSQAKEIAEATMMTTVIAGGVLLQWPLGKLSDFFERRKMLLITVILGFLLSSFIFFYSGANGTFLLVLTFLIGGFAFTLYPLGITQVCDHLDPDHITTATALLLIYYGIGSVLGPLACSQVIAYFGIEAYYVYVMSLLGLLGCIGLYTMMKRPVIPFAEQNAFLPLPNVTPVAYEMDPRGDSDNK